MRRRTNFCLMWLGCAMCCAAAASVADDPTSRDRLAADAIRAGQSQDFQAIPTLANWLSHDSRIVRQSSAWALTQMGSSVSDIAPELTKALADEDAQVRCAAATSLGHIGRQAWRAESTLWQATLDRDADVRCAALIALRTVSVSTPGSALGTLSECLQSSVADVQAEAIATATIIQSRCDDAEKRLLVPHLVRLLATAHDDQRLAAIVLLGDLGLPAAPAIPVLANVTADLDEHARAAAIHTLGRFADDLDQHWNQLPADQRAALRRPCELATKAWANHDGESSEVLRLAERFQQLTDGIQLASENDRIATPKADGIPVPTALATKESSPTTSTSWDRVRIGGGVGLVACVGLWLLWQVWSRQTELRAYEDSRRDLEGAVVSLENNRSLTVAAPSSPQALADSPLADESESSQPLPPCAADTRASTYGSGSNAFAPFVQALQDEDASVRQAAAVTLGQIGLGAIDAVPQLTLALSDAEPSVRAAAAFALSAFGPHAMESVLALRSALSDDFPGVRARAAFALGQIGPAARRTAEELARLVSDPDVSVRRNSASALGGIGADITVAGPALRLALLDPDAGVRRCAVTAWALINPEPQPPRAAATLKLYRPEPIRSEEFCPQESVTAESVPHHDHTLDATDFLAQLEDTDSEIRLQAAQELSRLGASAVPEMIASLNHRNSEVRRLLIHALGHIGASARAAVPSLLIALHDVNADVRCAAAECLGRFDIVTRAMLQELRQALTDLNSEVRRSAATTLGRLGQNAGEATTDLQVAAISDSATKVRVAAQAALQRITESLARAA